MELTLLRQHFARWNPLHFDSAGASGTSRGSRVKERSGERKWSYSLQSKGVLQPNEVVISKPRVQQRPSGKEGVHPFETATTAATPRDERNARESFMMRIDYILGSRGCWRRSEE